MLDHATQRGTSETTNANICFLIFVFVETSIEFSVFLPFFKINMFSPLLKKFIGGREEHWNKSSLPSSPPPPRVSLIPHFLSQHENKGETGGRNGKEENKNPLSHLLILLRGRGEIAVRGMHFWEIDFGFIFPLSFLFFLFRLVSVLYICSGQQTYEFSFHWKFFLKGKSLLRIPVKKLHWDI